MTTKISSVALDQTPNYQTGVDTELDQMPKHQTGFDAEVVQLGPNFRDGMPLTQNKTSDLVQKKVLQKVKVQVHEENGGYTFAQNGFEFHNFNNRPLGTAIKNLSQNLSSKEHRIALRKHIENEFTQWGKREGIQFTKAVCVDSVVRNTKGDGMFGAVHLVHADFPPTNYRATLVGHNEWKEKVEESFGPLTQSQYESLNVKKVVNVWMSLDDRIEAEPLALMDTSSLASHQIRPYSAGRVDGRAFNSLGIFPDKEQHWVTKKDMALGEAVVFDSCRTPHTAVTKPNQGDKTRTSVECRVLFLGPQFQSKL